MTKRIYFETLKSALGRSISHNCNFLGRGGNFPWGGFSLGAIIPGATFRGHFSGGAFFPGAFFLRTLLKTVLLFLLFSKKKKDISSYIFKILRKYQGEINARYLLSSKTKNALNLEIFAYILNFMKGTRDVVCNKKKQLSKTTILRELVFFQLENHKIEYYILRLQLLCLTIHLNKSLKSFKCC